MIYVVIVDNNVLIIVVVSVIFIFNKNICVILNVFVEVCML